jgi:hypothetical protein
MKTTQLLPTYCKVELLKNKFKAQIQLSFFIKTGTLAIKIYTFAKKS